MASGRPRRNASVRLGHIEPQEGAEQYSLDQVRDEIFELFRVIFSINWLEGPNFPNLGHRSSKYALF